MVKIEKENFTLTRKGNTLVAIDPAGRYAPLYQRERYRQDTPRWQQLTCFVSDEQIEW